jgi:hypothetical protein
LANVQNTSQQVLSEYSQAADKMMKLSNNPTGKKIAEETALREISQKFYRVSTNNLGDGQLAIYLIKNNSK